MMQKKQIKFYTCTEDGKKKKVVYAAVPLGGSSGKEKYRYMSINCSNTNCARKPCIIEENVPKELP